MQCPVDQSTPNKQWHPPRETCAKPPPTLQRRETALFQDMDGVRLGWSDGREKTERFYRIAGAILSSLLLVGLLYLAILVGNERHDPL